MRSDCRPDRSLPSLKNMAWGEAVFFNQGEQQHDNHDEGSFYFIILVATSSKRNKKLLPAFAKHTNLDEYYKSTQDSFVYDRTLNFADRLTTSVMEITSWVKVDEYFPLDIIGVTWLMV